MSVSYSVSIGAAAGGTPQLDGQVTSSAQILAVVNNSANAGKSYWMRGGSYGTLDLGEDARPSSLITFKTYPGEQVRFSDVSFFRTANIRFDGNADNTVRGETVREAADGLPEGHYGLWFRGSGVAGNTLPPVGNCITFHEAGPAWTENMQFANFRVGDDAGAPSGGDTPWRRQHGIVIGPVTRDLLFEDFELAYIGADLTDMAPAGDGDANGGGYGVWWFGNSNTTWGNHTFRRGHFHHTMNDFWQYGPTSPTAEVLVETCLHEAVTNYGDAHADVFQAFGGSQKLTWRDCVFRDGTDWLLHGDNPGQTRLWTNCLFDNCHQIVLGKDNEGGADSYEWRSCTINGFSVTAIRVDSTAGAAFTSDNVVSNTIYQGLATQTNVTYANAISNGGLPNVVTGGGTGLSGDTAGTPTFNGQMECTNFSQGWRVPVGFPWTL